MTKQTTDSITQAAEALQAMDEHAQRVRQVVMQIVGEHSATLPALLDIRTEASTARQHIALQPRTEEDARQWAAALGVDLTVDVQDCVSEGWRGVRTAADWVVDGVEVHLGSYESHSPAAWAERTAAAVAA